MVSRSLAVRGAGAAPELRVHTEKQWLRGRVCGAVLELRDEHARPVEPLVLAGVGRWVGRRMPVKP